MRIFTLLGKREKISYQWLVSDNIRLHPLPLVEENYGIGIARQVEEFFKRMPVGSGEICKTLQGTIAQSDHQEA